MSFSFFRCFEQRTKPAKGTSQTGSKWKETRRKVWDKVKAVFNSQRLPDTVIFAGLSVLGIGMTTACFVGGPTGLLLMVVGGGIVLTGAIIDTIRSYCHRYETNYS